MNTTPESSAEQNQDFKSLAINLACAFYEYLRARINPPKKVDPDDLMLLRMHKAIDDDGSLPPEKELRLYRLEEINQRYQKFRKAQIDVKVWFNLRTSPLREIWSVIRNKESEYVLTRDQIEKIPDYLASLGINTSILDTDKSPLAANYDLQFSKTDLFRSICLDNIINILNEFPEYLDFFDKKIVGISAPGSDDIRNELETLTNPLYALNGVADFDSIVFTINEFHGVLNLIKNTVTFETNDSKIEKLNLLSDYLKQLLVYGIKLRIIIESIYSKSYGT